MAARAGGDFTGLSKTYQEHRPDYPAEITAAGAAYLTAGGRATDAGLLVVDVGAGTGISTRAWRRALGDACRIVGVEPGADMRREAVGATPADQRIDYREGSAEALPIAAGEAGLVTAAQAAHWFDRPRFYAEANRALGAAGVVAIMGNHRDWTASRFLDAFESLLEAHSPGYRRDYRRTAFAAELARLPWVADSAVHAHRWARRLPPEALGGLLLSSSITQRAIATLGAAGFHAALDRMIADALDPDGHLEFPYVAEIHLARKRRA